MNKVLVIFLRALIAIMAAAVVFGIIAKPSFSDAVMGAAFLAFCSAIWLAVGTLNGPIETLKERLSASSKKMVQFGLISAIGIGVHQILQLVWSNA